ncbi:unnamed protein product [Darwinula stevensoni]|uniref:Uncharacterized protein n=1 Tax=Darwinula stevensoni TaxID=69355 RepID=A0A7R9ABZ9_9CRUS|nr:unnamed protein product [Darwinula stevensoni]CAG0899904.1 unnamed protein product [Darwinula stevensoni]
MVDFKITMPPFSFFFSPYLFLVVSASKPICPARSILHCNCNDDFSMDYYDGKVQVDCSRAGSDEDIAVSLKNVSWPSTEIWQFKIYNNTRAVKLPVGILGDLTLQSVWISKTAVTRLDPSVILPSADRLVNFTLKDSRLEEFPFHITPRLRSLKNLWLRNNLLTSVPGLHSDSLEILDLEYNRIAAVEEDKWVTPNLRGLNIAATARLGGSLSSSSRQFKIYNNTRAVKLPVGILGDLTLQSVWISKTVVTRLDPSVILPSADRLVNFTLKDSQLEEFPFHITPRLRSLKNLWLRNNLLTSVPGLHSDSLEILDLEYNRIAAVEEDKWVTPNLRGLNIGHNPLSKFPSAVIRRLGKLQEFYCLGCNLGTSLAKGQLEFRTEVLKTVSLQDDSLSQIEPGALAGVRADTKVYLSRNNITILNENAFLPLLKNISRGDGLLYLEGRFRCLSPA